VLVFGGHDEENNKLNDTWKYDVVSEKWEEVKVGGEEGFVPVARSGHSAVEYGGRMFIFGGLVEVTQELNDMVVFDMKTK
jgi:hypothetical protein